MLSYAYREISALMLHVADIGRRRLKQAEIE